MGLFWVAIQQFCFTCIKYAHDDIVKGRAAAMRLVLSQLFLFLLLAAYCFERELGIGFSYILCTPRIDVFPWSVRIVICGAMILFDSLLVLYFWRIVRVYQRGLEAARPTFVGDLGVVAFVLFLSGGYVLASVGAADRLGLAMLQYMWIGRFFIQISNFFYIGLEVGGALLFWFFLKHLSEDRSPEC